MDPSILGPSLGPLVGTGSDKKVEVVGAAAVWELVERKVERNRTAPLPSRNRSG